MYRYLCLLCLSILIGFSSSRPASLQENGLELLLAARNCRLPYRWIDNVCRNLGENVTPPSVQSAADSQNLDAVKNVVKNVVNVPQNCQKDQQLINGECRDVWLQAKDIDANSNVVTAPNNCPAGQEWINGQCRDVWALIVDALKNETRQKFNANYLSNLVISALDKQSHDENTAIQQISVVKQSKVNNEDNDIEAKNIITVPNQCPDGFRPDSNGKCREIW